MIHGQSYKTYEIPRLQHPYLLVGWNQDVARLGSKILGFLIKNLNVKEFARINAPGFFSLAGVPVEENVIQFPRSRFYYCEEKNLLIFDSDGPAQSHYEFLDMALDVAGQASPLQEMYTIGGIVSLLAHTSPRRISSVVNEAQLKPTLAEYGLNTNLEYETPVGARPTLSSMLLWIAQKRHIAGANVWVDVPFYLAALKDPQACKQVLAFFDRKFGLGLDFSGLDKEIAEQNKMIFQLMEKDSEVHKYIGMLERGIMLSEKESEELASKVADFLS